MNALVVLPTYNEAPNIQAIVSDLEESVPGCGVLVVDDNSPDGTGGLVRSMMSPGRKLSILERPCKQGLGAAYLAGFQHVLARAQADVVVQMDADGSHDPGAVTTLIQALASADLALGSRYVTGGAVEGWPWLRKALSAVGNSYARLWLSREIADWTGGFKAWRTDCLRGIDLSQVRSDGYAFQVELTARALGAGFQVAEVPITFRNRTRGKSKMTPAVAAEAVRIVPSLRRYVR
ncbi:MAG TPA: polyprenol monophosphomannose synthase [Mycobacteriales bacterium]|nr:polyprenol monophosphomannose synthase [Mycobacteriales bacterium]